MKISNKIIEETISEVSGEDTLKLVRVLKNKKNVSEFKLAEDIDKEVNETRNMLYRLYYLNLVSFIRRKDKKKGWYIYYWTFNPKIIKHLVFDLKKKKLDRLKERFDRERNNQFFICTNKCIRLDFEQAVDFEYKCPECGALMFEDYNIDKIKKLEKEIKELEKELKKQ